jgi:hypothetical protein
MQRIVKDPMLTSSHLHSDPGLAPEPSVAVVRRVSVVVLEGNEDWQRKFLWFAYGSQGATAGSARLHSHRQMIEMVKDRQIGDSSLIRHAACRPLVHVEGKRNFLAHRGVAECCLGREPNHFPATAAAFTH